MKTIYLVIIGNILSFGAAVFGAAGSWTKTKEKIFAYQTWQCFLLAFASVFFQSGAGVVTSVLCGIRNILVARNKFTKKSMWIILVVLTVLGIWSNNRGLIGWLIIIATFLYTLGAYYFTSEIWLKWNILMDLVLWIIYEFFVWDFASLIADSILVMVTLVSMVRIPHHTGSESG